MWKGRPYKLRLLAIAAAALAVRLLYALVVMGDVAPSGDGHQFHLLARVLAQEGAYLEPLIFLQEGRSLPTAEKPPLFPAYLALGNLLGVDSYEAHRVMCCLLGAAATFSVGLVGRRVAGERSGLIAAGLAAAYPMLIVLDGGVRNESLYVLLIALSLLFAYRLRDTTRWPDAAGLGALLGLAALTRTEAVFLIPLLVLPAVLMARPDARGRLRLGLVAVAAFVVVIAPYEIRNLTTFDRPVALSTNEGGLLFGANCDLAYNGVEIGTWPCYSGLKPTRAFDGSDVSWHLRGRALRYIGDNADRLPAVIPVRILRTWELWDTRDQASIEVKISERNLRFHQAGVAALFVLIALAVVGAVTLRRRGQPLALLLAPVVLVTVVSALTYGTSRFRAAADVALVVLASVALDRLAERRYRPKPP